MRGWHQLFIDDADRRFQMCDGSRTLVAKANTVTALITHFDVDMETMGTMMVDPELRKMVKNYVEKHSPYTTIPLGTLVLILNTDR